MGLCYGHQADETVIYETEEFCICDELIVVEVNEGKRFCIMESLLYIAFSGFLYILSTNALKVSVLTVLPLLLCTMTWNSLSMMKVLQMETLPTIG